MNRSFTPVLKYILIFILAFLSRIIHALIVDYFDGDISMNLGGEERYKTMAGNFINHGNMYLDYSYLSRTPLYMYFLSLFIYLFDKWEFYVVFSQIIITSLICLIIMRTAEMIRKSWALPAGIVSSLCPSLIIYGTSIQPEPLFMFFLSLSVMLAVKIFNQDSGRRDFIHVVAIGIFVTLSAYTRVASFFLPIFFVPCLFYLFLKKREIGMMQSFVFSLVPALIMLGAFSPRLINSYLDHGNVIITTQSGTSHFLGHVFLPIAVAGGKTREEILQSLKDFREDSKLSIEKEMINKTFVDQSESVEYAEVREHQEAMQEFWRLVRGETVESILYASSLGLITSLLETSLSDFVSFQIKLDFFRDNEGNLRYLIYLSALFLVCVRLLQVYSLVMIGLTLKRLDIFMLFSCYIMYFAWVNGPVGYVKYRLPMEPVLLILLGGAISQGYEFYRRRFQTSS